MTIGTSSDAAWGGSGDGTLIAIMKRISSLTGGGSASLPTGADRSITMTSASTVYQVAAANVARVALTLQVNGGDVWVREFASDAALNSTGSYKIPDGQSFAAQTQNRVSVISSVAGVKVTATET